MNNWHYVGTTKFEYTGVAYKEYVNDNGTKCKRVWNDGEVEIFDLD